MFGWGERAPERRCPDAGLIRLRALCGRVGQKPEPVRGLWQCALGRQSERQAEAGLCDSLAPSCVAACFGRRRRASAYADPIDAFPQRHGMAGVQRPDIYLKNRIHSSAPICAEAIVGCPVLRLQRHCTQAMRSAACVDVHGRGRRSNWVNSSTSQPTYSCHAAVTSRRR